VVKVRVNPEASPADQALMRSFGARAFPSLFVIPAPEAAAQAVSEFTRWGRENIVLKPETFVNACEKVGLGRAQAFVRDGVAKTRSGNYLGARADLDRAVELDSRNAEAFFWLGYCEEHIGTSGKAAGAFRRSVDLDPKDPRPYAELARVYGRNRQFEDAIEALDRLIELAPDWQWGLAFAMRATAQIENGDSTRAAADQAEACRRGHRLSCTGVQKTSPSREPR
jgi:tetratricopeptide (TPR) repeat protein